MSDLVKRILDERRPTGEVAHQQATEQPRQEDCNFFSILLGDGVAEDFLEFKMKNGTRVCFSYSSLLWFNFNPDAGCIDLQFDSVLVTIMGKGLDRKLWQGIKRKKVVWVREADSEGEDTDENEVYISEILVTPSEE